MKCTMAIETHMTEDVYEGIVEGNFSATVHITKNMKAKKEHKHCIDSLPIQKVKMR